jgi:hypothetical protein
MSGNTRRAENKWENNLIPEETGDKDPETIKKISNNDKVTGSYQEN